MRTVLRSLVRPAAIGAALLTLGLALVGCSAKETPGSMFLTGSDQAAEIADLAYILGGIAIFVVVAVNFAVILAALRGRRRPESQVRQIHGNVRLEITWTTITAVVFMAIFAITVKVLIDVTASPEAAVAQTAFPGDTVTMKATGWRWWWAFEYSQAGVVTANEVYVPLEKPVFVEVMSGDVIHSFWVPRLAGKMDMIPGRTNYLKFVATAPGTYQGVCAEFCGAEHARMQFKIVAVSVPDFTAWAKAQAAPAAQPQTEPQRAGLAAFQTNCAQCHTVRGTQAQGKLGPDLTHFGSRTTLAAGTLPNTPENIANWIQHTQQIKPESQMPELNIGPAVEPLTAYLTSLK